MSGARVFPLPGAAAAPVVNPKRRGGTPPSNVTRRAVLEGRRHRRAMFSIRRTPEPNPQLVWLLGGLLELAERGELQGLAFVYNFTGRVPEGGTVINAEVDRGIVGNLGPDTLRLSQVVMRMLCELMTGKEDRSV